MKIALLESAGFSGLGWFSEPASYQLLSDVLKNHGIHLDLVEVKSERELDQALLALGPDTLVWPNAYHLPRTAGDDAPPLWLASVLETRDVPFLGSPASALDLMLHKDRCQQRLAAAGIPTPASIAVSESHPALLRSAFEEAALDWPVVVKPTCEAGSRGISLAQDWQQLQDQVRSALAFPGQRALIEAYLPSADVTVGVLAGDLVPVLLPTWYEIVDREPGSTILDRQDRLRAWGGTKQMRTVHEPDVLRQLEELAPRVMQALGIRDVTRMDGRLDADGVLRIFDVNGMPALDVPDAVILRQLLTLWDLDDSRLALERLALHLIRHGARRYGLEVPEGPDGTSPLRLDAPLAVAATP